MVSLWPFRGEDKSAASFEKVLSQQTIKINKATAQNERLRSSQRRYRALWTLYASFVYIVVALIFVLVVGWQSWTAVEYSIVAGSPVLIYGVRTTLDAYYNYRLAGSETRLKELREGREASLKKLKAAFNYDSTQQLLDKYADKPSAKEQAPKKSKNETSKEKQGPPQPPAQRTGFVPPPTANIPRQQPPPPPPTDAQDAPSARPQSSGAQSLPGSPSSASFEPSAEFAPNAFVAPPLPSQYAADGPAWYDRLMDLVLGEDETQAKNRIALICQNCRLVNGQAPPGARTLEEIGRWRCSSCHAWNGVESETKKMMKEITGEPTSPSSPQYDTSAPHPVTSDEDDFEEVEDETAQDGDEISSPAASTRSKARQKKKA